MSQSTDTSARRTVAILSSRETARTLIATISAAFAACGKDSSNIDVVINGNKPLANEVVDFSRTLGLAKQPSILLRVWYIRLADKANAWNQYMGRIWEGGAFAYFLDGYARSRPDAFLTIEEALRGRPECMAATGVPNVGRSARAIRDEMIRQGGMHGNLFALRGELCSRLRSADIRLPLGLYGVDSALAAVINFHLDPATHQWDSRRILVVPKATWDFDPLSWWKPKDLVVHWKRIVRQQ